MTLVLESQGGPERQKASRLPASAEIFFDGHFHCSFGLGYIAQVEADLCGEHKLDQTNGLLGAATPYFLYLTFGLHTGVVWLTVRLDAVEPPVDDLWEEIVEAPFMVEEGPLLGVMTWAGETFEPLPLAAGSYRARYSALNYGAAEDALPLQEDSADPAVPIERYELIFWPCEPKPDAVIKVTSKRAAYEHHLVQNREALEREARRLAVEQGIAAANQNLDSLHASALACARAGDWEGVDQQQAASWRELALTPWANEAGWRTRAQTLLELCALSAADKAWSVLTTLVRAVKDAADRNPADAVCREALARTYALSIVPLRQNNEGEAAAQMLAGLAALAHRNPSDETLRKVLAEVAIQG